MLSNTVNFNGTTIAPSKIFCVGRNYGGHIKEMGSEQTQNPIIFMKPNTAIGRGIQLNLDDVPDYEAEICLLMQNQAIAGVGFGLDLTKRALQNELKDQGLPWELCKAFDGSALFSDFVPLNAVPPDTRVRLDINGSTVQSGLAKEMIFSPETVIAFIRQFFTINDGDIIMTGTPEGVGKIPPGAKLKGQLEHGSTQIVSAEWQAG